MSTCSVVRAAPCPVPPRPLQDAAPHSACASSRAQETFMQWDQCRRFYNFLMADNMKKIILSHRHVTFCSLGSPSSCLSLISVSLKARSLVFPGNKWRVGCRSSADCFVTGLEMNLYQAHKFTISLSAFLIPNKSKTRNWSYPVLPQIRAILRVAGIV